MCPTLNWHNIYLYQPLRTYHHHSTSLPLTSPSTSAHIIHLSTCGPTTLHSTSSNNLSSPFNTLIFFPDPRAPLIPSPCLNRPPQSVYLCLKPSYPSLTRPVISLSFQPAQSGRGSITRQFGSIHTCLCLSASLCQCLRIYGAKSNV